MTRAQVVAQARLQAMAVAPAGLIPATTAGARAAIDAAQAREVEIADRIQGAEQSRRAALDARAELVARIAAGEALPASGIAAATAAIAGAEESAALLQEALRAAETATRQAQARLGALLAAELERRYPLVCAARDAALDRFLKAQEEHGRLDVLAGRPDFRRGEVPGAAGRPGAPAGAQRRGCGPDGEGGVTWRPSPTRAPIPAPRWWT